MRFKIVHIIHRPLALTSLILLVFALPSNGQIPNDRSQLEADRKQLLAEIKANNDKLSVIQVDKASKEEQLFLLQSQARKRERLIFTLEQEIQQADAGIARVDEVVTLLGDDLNTLRDEYAKVLRAALRHKLSGSWRVFLFSAQNLNDAFRRWQYYRQYDRYRNRQALLIEETQQTLIDKKEQLAGARVEKEDLLRAAESQQATLNAELEKIAVLVTDLKKNEKQLLAQIQQQQKAHEQMNAAIELVIREETKKRKEEAKNPTVTSTSRSDVPVAAATGGFLPANRGKLPWPVDDGMIVKSFGRQAHPTLKSVYISNNGIDIRSGAGSEVRAVFDGKVSGILFVPSYRNAVILQHGDYYTVYSNLDVVSCKREDMIKAGQSLGTLAAEDPEVHFELWHEKQHLNPALWLKKQ
ncbi:MAG: peptidoglycan DD-metalloendopeptidase family protein [Lewinellaceae bacterium]|nr:peptidoglycan DD-metalloendopeptidase family protein [Lewinella sp.]MCB9280314.1 peptidoglycan DD-metalloendopeptidase family protein [Lewinellaceae bacterium]